MGKLTNLRPSLSTLRPTIGFGDRTPTDNRLTPAPYWKQWYHTARWRRLRDAVLLRDMFTCQMCGKMQHDTSKLVADHKIPHRGRPHLFWNEANIQTLCADPCHNSKKQAEEAKAPRGVWD